jgi:HK97 family phage major capsid protein
MTEEEKKAIRKILDGEPEPKPEDVKPEETPVEPPKEEEKPAEEPEDSKVSVDALAAADRIADRIAKVWAEQKDATATKDAEDARKHLFQTSDGVKRDHGLDLRKMKLNDFDLKTVEEIQEKYAGQKVTITPFRLTGGPKEMDAPAAARILGFFKGLLDRDLVTLKALSETDADGGYLVPEEFRAEVVREQLNFGVMRRIARVFPMNTDTLDIPTLAARPAAYWTSENATLSTSSAEFGQVTLSPSTLVARLPVSRQLAADSAINIVSFITELFAEEITRAEDKAFFTGSGTGQPKGINQETLKTVAAGGVLDFDDLIGLFYKLQARHRASASAAFVGARRTIEILRKVKDSYGQYVWQASVQLGQPDRILGIPILEQNDISESELYFGDWAYYFIGDREQMTVETSTEGGTAWERHRLEIKAATRVDGKCALVAPFAKITTF